MGPAVMLQRAKTVITGARPEFSPATQLTHSRPRTARFETGRSASSSFVFSRHAVLWPDPIPCFHGICHRPSWLAFQLTRYPVTWDVSGNSVERIGGFGLFELASATSLS